MTNALLTSPAIACIEFTAPAPLPPPLPKLPAQNFIARHWRGELSLPHAFWLNYVVLSLGVGILLYGLETTLERHAVEQPVRWLMSHSLHWGVISLFSVWALVGIWRSAVAYRSAGHRFWGTVAKVTVALFMFQLACCLLFIAFPKIYGDCEIVAGDPRIGPHQFKMMNNGTMLDFSGGITFGTAREFEMMLNAMDNVRTVRLTSNGGRIAEAQKISDLIRARGLSTYVVRQCASACTIVFLGGKQRYLLSKARLGFHQSSFLGMTEADRRAGIAREEMRLQYFGLSRAFAERANATRPEGMWFPEESELLRERVVTMIVTPQPPKPIAPAAPAQAATVSNGPTLQAVIQQAMR